MRGHPENDKVRLFIGDVLLIAVTILLLSLFHPAESISSIMNATAVAVFVLTFLANLYIFDLYDLSSLNGITTGYRLVVACGLATLLLSMWFSFVPWFGGRRNSLILSGPILLAALYTWRHFYVYATHLSASRERVLVIGSPCDADKVCSAIDSTNSRFDIVGFLSSEGALTPPENSGNAHGGIAENEMRADTASVGVTSGLAASKAFVRALAKSESRIEVAGEPPKFDSLGVASAKRLLELVYAYDVQCLVVNCDSFAPELAAALTRLRFEGIRIYPLADFYMKLIEDLPLEVLSDSWLPFADGFNMLHARLFRKVKRLVDLLLAAVGLLFSLPVLLVAAIALKLDSRGPLLYRQWRVGWMGRPYKILKLRSMRADAESDGKAQWAKVNDPRVTRVGRILRKFHVDELPQLINILRGDMSFIGPRPERPEFVEKLFASVPFYHLRHYIPPGITGWAQVKYPYGADVEDARRKLQFDLYYIRNASLLLDLRILLRTARVILFHRGSR